MEKRHIVDIKVLGLAKIRKDKIAGKRYEFILHLRWSNNTDAIIYRPHSMLFDFQAVLVEMFISYRIPNVPLIKFHWGLLKKVGNEKDCKAVEEFCNKIIQLPDEVSKSSLVLHFFDLWGTDIRTNIERRVLETADGTKQKSSKLHKDEQYKVIANYQAINIGEVSLVAGEFVTIVEKNERGWWFVADNAGKQGWAPATYLEPVKNATDDFGYDWVSVITEGKGEIYKSVNVYNSQNDDELSYPANEEIEVIEKSQYGWWKIRYHGKVGLTPATNLRNLDEEFVESENNRLNRVCSISSATGLYAIIRKPPPRRESVCSWSSISDNQSKLGSNNSLIEKRSSRYVYSAASFSGGKFVIQDQNNLKPIDFELRRGSDGDLLQNDENDSSSIKKAYKSIRSKSTGNVLDEIPLNHMQNYRYINQRKQNKPGKNGEVEYYIALLDYIPTQQKKDDLALCKGDVVQLVSTDSGWMFVMLIEQGNSNVGKQGWVPETYLERKLDFDNDSHKVRDIPKPRPRPRPSPRPREQPKTSPILGDTDHDVQAVTTKSNSPPSSEPKLLYKRDLSDQSLNPKNDPGVSTRAQLPTPLLNDICNVRKYEEDLHYQPEVVLRSVYDAEPWFFGKISRADCERILSAYGRQQEFLVRESQRAPGSYALSVKYCYRIRHFPIESENDQLLIGKLTFSNLMDIVSYYQKYPLFYSEHKEPITLGMCFSKEKVPK